MARLCSFPQVLSAFPFFRHGFLIWSPSPPVHVSTKSGFAQLLGLALLLLWQQWDVGVGRDGREREGGERREGGRDGEREGRRWRGNHGLGLFHDMVGEGRILPFFHRLPRKNTTNRTQLIIAVSLHEQPHLMLPDL